MNAAKRYNPEESSDTVLIGTREYAAPEQYGFGTSSVRTDIYAIGVMFNVMLEGRYPKEKLTDGKYREIIEKCTKLDPGNRYESAQALKTAILAASRKDS